LTNAKDTFCCLLRCDAPLLLRPTSSDAFEVVGDCYFYHLVDEKVIVGPLPMNIMVQIAFDDHSTPLKQFHNVAIL